MANNPDVYLLYEYRKKNAFTVRLKVTLDEPVDEALLTQAATEAMTRFPYYSVKVGLDEGENYVLLPNDRQIKVLPEKDQRMVLGSEEVAEHIKSIFTITDGNLMLEVNALPDKFCVTFQLLKKDRKPLDLFCDVLKEEQLPYTVSEGMVRHMPDLQLPKPKSELSLEFPGLK